MVDTPEILINDPGNPEFADYAEGLRRSGNFSEAMNICLRGLSANPACHKGRLILARVYFDQKLMPFALKELEQLQGELPENKLVSKLLDSIAPGNRTPKAHAGPDRTSTETETIAEADFAFDDLDLIEEDQRSKNK